MWMSIKYIGLEGSKVEGLEIMLSKRIRPFGSRNKADIADWELWVNNSISFVQMPWRSLGRNYFRLSLPSRRCRARSVSFDIKPDIITGRRLFYEYWIIIESCRISVFVDIFYLLIATL